MKESADSPSAQSPTGTHSLAMQTASPALPDQSGMQSCPTCGAATSTVTPSYLYAIGRIEPRLSVEKEFVQAIGRAETAGLTDRQALHTALTQEQNRYLARQLCWVLMIGGVETYLLAPHDPSDLHLLVEAVRPMPHLADLDAVIGLRGPAAPLGYCGGLTVPIVMFEQLYTFEIGAFIDSIPRPEGVSAEHFRPTAEELFRKILQMADNTGATDEHRALNYLVLRYPRVYALAAERHAQNASLSAVEVKPSPLSGARKIVEAIFTFTHRQTDVSEKYFARVDVTELFPFMVSKLTPYYDL